MSTGLLVRILVVFIGEEGGGEGGAGGQEWDGGSMAPLPCSPVHPTASPGCSAPGSVKVKPARKKKIVAELE